MAGKFVDLKEAATMIGVSPEELIDLRSKGEIFGYRDGASWKFKTEEVERVVRERGVEARGGDSSILSANDDDFDNMISGLSSKILAEKAQEEPGSVLISEQELGVSTKGKSTIIGPPGSKKDKAGDSDLRLAGDSDKDLKGGSDKLLEAPGSVLEPTSASDVLHGSDIQPSGGSGTGAMPLPKGGSTGDLQISDDLSLSEDDDLEIGSSDSALDDEIRPRGSGKGSDITMGTGDSGINLSPADSGLSLEDEPLDLGGSAVESLELPEDEELIGGGDDAEQATQMKQDNEFLLSGGESIEDESSDSGSQVIALEDSESFDQDAATMVGAEQAGAGLEMEFTPLGAEEGMALDAGPVAAQPAVYVSTPTVELPYSIWNVTSLGLVAGVLALAGMMMVDVMLNMWSFSGTNSISTGIMDAFVGVLGKK